MAGTSLDERAAEDHVRNRHQQRLVVDRREQSLGIHVHRIVVRHHLHAGAPGALGFPEIHHRREVQVGVDDLVAAPAEIEAGRDHRFALRHVLVQRNRSRRRVHQRGDLIADLAGEHPPAVRPCPDAAGGPDVGVVAHRIRDAARHGAEELEMR
jgi:hypothetical protein